MSRTPLEADDRYTRVFISYSRRDREHLDRLLAAFAARDIEIFRDLDDILPTEDWWERIKTLIVQADTVVFLISPDSVDSRVCLQELAYAASLNKRLAPVVISPVNETLVPPSLTKLNFIFLDAGSDAYARAFDALVTAISTDIAWVREHTRLGELARRWVAVGRPQNLLLRGSEIAKAEEWLQRAPAQEPLPSQQQREFIGRSRRGATIRKRTWYAGSAAAAVALMAGSAVVLSEQESSYIAKRQQLAIAAHTAIAGGSVVKGMLLALEAVPDEPWNYLRGRVREGELALYEGLHAGGGQFHLFEHSESINVAKLSPDERILATTSDDRTVRLWDVKSGQQLAILAGHFDEITDVAFSPDGKMLVSASKDWTARIWGVEAGRLRHILYGHSGPISQVSFDPAGRRIVTAAEDGTARVWSADSGDQLSLMKSRINLLKPRKIEHAAFVPDGKAVLLIEGGTQRWAWLFDPATGERKGKLAAFYEDAKPSAKELQEIFKEDGSIGHVPALIDTDTRTIYSTDGQRTVTKRFDKVWLSDARTGKEIKVVKTDAGFIPDPYGNNSSITFAAFSPDNRIFITGNKNGQSLEVWRADSGDHVCTIALDGNGSSLRFSGNGRYLVGEPRNGRGRDRVVWQTDACFENSKFGQKKQFFPGRGRLNTDGSKFIHAHGGTVGIWGTSSGKQLTTIGKAPWIETLAMRPGGRFAITTGRKGQIAFWDSATGGQLDTTFVHNHPRPPEFSPLSDLVITVKDKRRAILWDAAIGKPIAVLPDDPREIVDYGFSRDGGHVLLFYSKSPYGRVFAATDGNEIRLPAGRELLTWRSFASFDQKRGLRVEKGVAQVYDIASNKALFGVGGSLRFFVTSADNSTLLTTDQQTGWLHDLRTGRQIGKLTGHLDRIVHVDLTFDATRALTAGLSDSEPRLWDGGSGELVKILKGHSRGLYSAAFSPDARRLVTGARDAILWDALTGARVAKLALSSRDRARLTQVSSVYFNQSMSRILTWDNEDDAARLWQVFPTSEALLDYAKRTIPRCLSRQERIDAGLSATAPSWCYDFKKPPYVDQAAPILPWYQTLAVRVRDALMAGFGKLRVALSPNQRFGTE